MKISQFDFDLFTSVNRKFTAVCLVAALMLSLRYYVGSAWVFSSWIDLLNEQSWKAGFADWLFIHNQGGLNPLLYWAAACLMFYLLIPALFCKFYLRNKLSDSGFQWGNSRKHLKTYGLLLAGILPLVFLASYLPGFQAAYPFLECTKENLSFERLLIWELAYFLQFVSIEYFFRGFLLMNLEPYIGRFSIMVSMLPYCMIHFGKPFPETIGAIFAGLILGAMALRSRSIFPGIILHYCVAITMDLLSLWQKGIL
jgi:membrane protease YdiL (CAAX protease family)